MPEDAPTLSTGIEALDRRIGGLVPGRYYLVTGSPGAGKTSAALQFVRAGLDREEVCAVLTQEDPRDLLAQAEFLGCPLRGPAHRNQLVLLQYRLDFTHNYRRTVDSGRLFEELLNNLGSAPLDRLVIDPFTPFLETGASEDVFAAFSRFLGGLNCTSFITVPGEVNDQYRALLLDRLMSGAAGIIHLESGAGQARRLSIRKIRHPVENTDPFPFLIRAGAGIIEFDEESSTYTLPEEARRRIVLFDPARLVPEELTAALGIEHEIATYDSIEGAFGELISGMFGALIIAVDPQAPQAGLQLTNELRKAGSGAPVLFYSKGEELRSSTRAEALHAGADDVLTDELSPHEFLERVHIASMRGHRHTVRSGGLYPVIEQPTDADGHPVPLGESAFRHAVAELLERTSHPFFTIVMMPLAPSARADVNGAVRELLEELRSREGDLAGQLDDGRIALCLGDVRLRHVRDLLQRLQRRQPNLCDFDLAQIYSYPRDKADIEEWITKPPEEQDAAAQEHVEP